MAIESAEGWLLHAGYAYFHRDEMRGPDRRGPPGLHAYQTLMEVDRDARRKNQERLRQLSINQRDQVRLICAHDEVEYDHARAGALL